MGLIGSISKIRKDMRAKALAREEKKLKVLSEQSDYARKREKIIDAQDKAKKQIARTKSKTLTGRTIANVKQAFADAKKKNEGKNIFGSGGAEFFTGQSSSRNPFTGKSQKRKRRSERGR